MRNVTIKQLRYFEALAQHGHFGQAAAACAISQPALSVQIRELEAEAGGPLFERGPRAVRLTRFGEDVAHKVRDILRGLDDLSDFTRATGDKITGRFHIGIIPTIAPYLLPGLVGRLDESHPGLDLHVRETLTMKLVSELLAGQIDAAIVALPVSEPALAELPVISEKFVFVRPMSQSDHPAPRGADLADMQLLLLEEGHCFRDQALAFCRAPSAVPRTGLDGSSLATLVQMTGSELGVTVIPEMAIPVETRSAAVHCTSFRGPQPKRTIGIIWRRSNPLVPQMQSVALHVREAAEEVLARARAIKK